MLHRPQDHGIGLQFALFYEAYATYYELRGNCSAADAVYQDGIHRWQGQAAGSHNSTISA